MKNTIQKLPKSQLEIKFEVPPEEFQDFVEKAILRLGENIEVEGFRKGKAPKETIEKMVGQEKILAEASQECVRETYLKTVKAEGIEPLGQPAVDILKLALGNPFEFKVRVAVLPEMALPDYKTIASTIKRREVKVTDEEIARLKQEKERVEAERLRQEILDKIAHDSKVEIPEVLVDSEKQRLLASIKEQVPQMLGISFDEYLKKIKKTEKEMLDSFASEAEKRIRNSLVLREIQKKEKIEISDKEIQDEMAKIAQADPHLDKNQLKEYTESVLKSEKAFKLLESFIKP